MFSYVLIYYSLCVADLLFCIIVLPFNGLRFLQSKWTDNEVLCKIIPFVQYGNVGVSLLCIAMITINRYVMIAHHTSYRKVYQKHWIATMILLCWILSYGMLLPTLFGIWGVFKYDNRLETCSIMTDPNGNSSKKILFIIAFVIPCIIIIACYSKIFWVVQNSKNRVKHHTSNKYVVTNHTKPFTGSRSNIEGHNCEVSNISLDNSSLQKHQLTIDLLNTKTQLYDRPKRNEWGIIKMVLAIFLSFIVCYLPITILKVMDQNVTESSWLIFGYIMLYLSACINPIIYVIMNKQFRIAYKSVFLCDLSILSSATENSRNNTREKWENHEVNTKTYRTSNAE